MNDVEKMEGGIVNGCEMRDADLVDDKTFEKNKDKIYDETEKQEQLTEKQEQEQVTD